MITLLWVALSMAAKDFLAVLLTVAEARGRPVLAGLVDGLLDIAAVITLAFGTSEIILHGWTPKAFAILAVMCATSFLSTMGATWWAKRIEPDPELA